MAKVYGNSGGTQKFGGLKNPAGIDRRAEGPLEPKEYHVQAGVCLQVDMKVKAVGEPEAEAAMKNLLDTPGMFENNHFQVTVQEIEFVEVIENELNETNP